VASDEERATALTTNTIDVTVREVGMRDGLQSIAAIMPTGTKKDWCDKEASCGIPEIEVCSFVPPRLLPQFADAGEIVGHALGIPGLVVSALIPNVKGAERAVAAGVHKMNYAMSVSESHNQANVRRSSQESLDDLARIVAMLSGLPKERRPRLSGGLATSFGCTIEGAVSERRVRDFAQKLARIGVDEIVLADTVGYANPASIGRVFRAVINDVAPIPVAAHFHDTRGLGLANVVAALDAGTTRFDASLGGFGGCPYAPGATGNIDMEDLVYMFESMGLRTGVDISALIDVRRMVEEALPGVPFAGAVATAGLPKNFSSLAV
jgi:hydroxymethylglutaryl-CoA lyase